MWRNMADAPDLGSGSLGSEGSTPSIRTCCGCEHSASRKRDVLFVRGTLRRERTENDVNTTLDQKLCVLFWLNRSFGLTVEESLAL